MTEKMYKYKIIAENICFEKYADTKNDFIEVGFHLTIDGDYICSNPFDFYLRNGHREFLYSLHNLNEQIVGTGIINHVEIFFECSISAAEMFYFFKEFDRNTSYQPRINFLEDGITPKSMHEGMAIRGKITHIKKLGDDVT